MSKDNYWSIRKFIDDTLKEVDGSWSMKRVCVAVLFPYNLGLGLYIVLSDKILDTKVVNPYAIQIFDSVLVFLAAALGITVVANYLTEKVKAKQDTYSETTTTEINASINPDEPIN